MNTRNMALAGAVLAVLICAGVRAAQPARNVQAQARVVRIAELEVDPTRLRQFKSAVREEMDTSIRIEPGVLAIYAVAEKGSPEKLTFFEMYADDAAYEAHRKTPHFRKYYALTKDMIRSRRLVEAVPVLLSGKAR